MPSGKPLHWIEHVKRFPRRQYVASQLAAVDGVVLNMVLVEKAAVARELPDQVAFYDLVAGCVLEQVLDTADEWPGGRRDVVITFGHVRGFRHDETLAWFEKMRARDSTSAPWDLLRGRPTFLGPGQLDGLQAADQYCGMLRAALEADEYGGFEEHHLTAVRRRLRRPDGFEAVVLPGTMTAYTWWPTGGL